MDAVQAAECLEGEPVEEVLAQQVALVAPQTGERPGKRIAKCLGVGARSCASSGSTIGARRPGRARRSAGDAQRLERGIRGERAQPAHHPAAAE